MPSKYYHEHTVDLKRELRAFVPPEDFKALHKKNAGKHFFILARQIFIVFIAGYLALHSSWWFFSFLGSIALGFVAFDWLILLHEVIHKAIFCKARPRFYGFLGQIYAILGGLSFHQFQKWHLDHHNELGSEDDDPKRAHLTPKIVKRWYKFLYMTPVLFPIYFRAAAQASRNYPTELKRIISRERSITIGFHFLLMYLLYIWVGPLALLRLHTIPYLFVFPVLFTINRLGQHYSVDPNDPAHWSTLMKGSFFWDFAYIYSNYHIEHHYFPGVPCYNLPRLQKILQPFYDKHQMTPESYFKLLYGWFIQNQVPHTKWT